MQTYNGRYLLMKVGHESYIGYVWNYIQCANCQRIG